MPQLIENIAENDYLGYLGSDPSEYDYKAVSDFLDLTKREASQMAGIAQTTVRYDSRIPGELAVRLSQIGNIINRVASLFEGDMRKTALWFGTPNPLLGEVSPRDMIRMDRFKRLARFVSEAEQAGS